jgi:hypothetical protein
MSINGHLREITPALLRRVQDDSSLTRTIILGSTGWGAGADIARTHFERLQASYPTREKEALAAALDNMSPAQRKIALFAVEKIGGFFKSAYSQPLDTSALEPGSLGEHLSIGKAWHGAHFLLSGAAEPTPTPLGQAILGGIEIGEDTGYGPPRYLDSEAVTGIAKALSALDNAELRRRYDADAMNAEELYLDVWSEPGSADWLIEECGRIREFYTAVGSRGNAVLLYHI